jgi:methionyl aminopeptidase
MTIRSREELEAMQRVGRVVAQTLAHMRALVAPGITTRLLDQAAERFARDAGARSAPQLTYDFPGFTCISVNDEIVHGVPGARTLAPGDVLKLDVTLELDGFMADSAITVLVPPVSEEARRLDRAARIALNQGLAAARAGTMLSTLGAVVEAAAQKEGANVLRQLCGHGIGRALHEAPSVPNWRDPDATQRLEEGLVIALEPMLTSRPARVQEARDGWTLRTDNRALAVHREHTIMIRKGAPLILTAA